MKTEFDFPRFEDLQLGPYGTSRGCGCLAAKIAEVSRNAGDFYINLAEAMVARLGRDEYSRLVRIGCPNTVANRRKAYQALERATEEVYGVDIGR